MADVPFTCRAFQPRLALLLLITALLLPSGVSAVAQDVTDETEITIAVRPGDSPGGTLDPDGPPPGPHADEPGPGTGNSATQGAPSGRFLGTLSALIVFFPTSDREAALPVLAYVLVCDDRGTAAGWNLGIALQGATQFEAPEILENRTGTIRRIMPADGRLSDQIDLVRSGRTLGAITLPALLLHAAPGGGSGVYLQELLMLTTVPQASGSVATLVVQLPFAP